MNSVESLVDQYGDALYQFCVKLCGNRTDADDLYQETFLKAVVHSGRIDESHNAKSYLFSMAVNTWKSSRRRYARRQRLVPSAPLCEAALVDTGASIEEEFLIRELCGQVRGTVERLDDKYRIPLYLFYTAGMTHEEIATAMRIPTGTVKSRLHKARALVKKRLEAIPHGRKCHGTTA